MKVKVANAGPTKLNDVGLRLTLAFDGSVKRAYVVPAIKQRNGLGGRPLVIAPHVYWSSFSLGAHKARRFYLKGGISGCQTPETLAVAAGAYIAGLNCSSAASAPIQVRRDRAIAAARVVHRGGGG